MSPVVRTMLNASYKGQKVLKSRPSRFSVFSLHDFWDLSGCNSIYNVLTKFLFHTFVQGLVAFM